MIFEIGVGVCVGIILAVTILKNSKLLLVSSIWLLVITVLIGLMILTSDFILSNQKIILSAIGALAVFAILYGVPFLIYNQILEKYPSFGILLHGKEPWNKISRLPIRLTIMTIFAVLVAGIGVSGMLVIVSLVENITKNF
jgi:hypothetical protein